MFTCRKHPDDKATYDDNVIDLLCSNFSLKGLIVLSSAMVETVTHFLKARELGARVGLPAETPTCFCFS